MKVQQNAPRRGHSEYRINEESQEVRPRNSGHIPSLPTELWMRIMEQLSDLDAARLSSTCRDIFVRRERSPREQESIVRKQEKLSSKRRYAEKRLRKCEYDTKFLTILSPRALYFHTLEPILNLIKDLNC